jgi:D-alanine-D-alanine ligase
VGVLRGGPSNEYDVSLQTGGSVLKALQSFNQTAGEKYQPHDIFISKSGVWHLGGFEKNPEQILKHLDVVFNALHGEYGEDGKVQQILDIHKIPYTGSGALASALAMNKVLTKKKFAEHNIKSPFYTVVKDGENIHERALHIFKSFPHPAIVKHATSGSSVGVSKVHTFAELEEAIHEALRFSETVLIEEFIKGREATCGVIDSFRDKQTYVLLPVEIIAPDDSSFFDYQAKYGGKSKEICPGNFTSEESAIIQNLSEKIHKALGLRHYSRSDFIISSRRGIYALEVNTLPGLTSESLLPKSLNAVGSNLASFLDHVIGLALRS